MAPDDVWKNIKDAVLFMLEIDVYWQFKLKDYMKRVLSHKNMFLFYLAGFSPLFNCEERDS